MVIWDSTVGMLCCYDDGIIPPVRALLHTSSDIRATV